MANVTIGDPIKTYVLFVRRRSVHGFVINWYEDEAQTVPKTDINGRTFKVIVGDLDSPIKTWITTAVSNVTSFYLTEEDSDLEFEKYDGIIMQSVGSDDTVLGNLKIIVEPF